MNNQSYCLPSDQITRERALNIDTSFIVQAPAGSGKTELLIQRYLALLGQACEIPENIIALTFTKKAAAEMRYRIITALQMAQHTIPTHLRHTQITQKLAKQVLARDQQCTWNILKNPQRLRIQTIDAFCHQLTQQLPITSKIGAMSNVCDDAQSYYVMAAQRLMASLETEKDPLLLESLQQLMLHLDNDYQKLETLLSDLLSKREQWLSHILACKKNIAALRHYLEKNLQTIAQENMRIAMHAFPKQHTHELLFLARYSAEQLIQSNSTSPIVACHNTKILPSDTMDDLSSWQGLIELLLTKNGEWRKQVDKRNGFPSTESTQEKSEKAFFKQMKHRMEQLLHELQIYSELREILFTLKNTPPLYYTEHQWQTINSLLQLLPLLSAHLLTIFREYHCTDFNEISQRALIALGDSTEDQISPTDIALQLDCQIQHILVDEFQDTSVVQFKLLEQLTREWTLDNKRTLFLVGDPMQSIYRFRAAEVGLFIHVREQGINNIAIESLTLTANFRSQAKLITWFNQTFQSIFPKQADIRSSAINFQPSEAMQDAITFIDAVHHYACQHNYDEATQIIHCIKQLQYENPGESIAILVRSRHHLKTLLPVLQQEQLHYQATDIMKLNKSSVVEDLWALTRALLHLGDRIAWLATLRAPWCGLTLNDLHVIANSNTLLWDRLRNFRELTALNEDAQQRLSHIVPILEKNLREKKQQDLRSWIENTWLELGGAACLRHSSELQDADHFFTLLNDMEIAGDIPDFLAFEQRLAKQYVGQNHYTDDSLHILTIHKAKGLEFDHVIIPGLDRTNRPAKSALFTWTERLNMNGEIDLLFAPISSPGKDKDAIYRYIDEIHAVKNNHEIDRLLYVAVTRAKKSLHLFARVTTTDETIKLNNLSFLAKLWPVVKNAFMQNNISVETNIHIKSPTKKMLRRLPISWFTDD